MMNPSKVIMALATVGLIASCDSGDGIVDLEDQANGRITITNSAATLADRLTLPDEEIFIDPPFSPGLSASSEAMKAPGGGLTLTLLGEVIPPTVGGEVLQATSASVNNNKVMVSYNMRGAPRLGAIDWITNVVSNPNLSASATFSDSDISAVSFDGEFVYAAEATGSGEFPFPSVLERIQLQGNSFTLDQNLRLPLTSYVATSTALTDNTVYATSGNTGHVFAYDKSTMALLGQFALDDARWIAWDEEGQRIVVAQGMPGRLSVFAEGSFPGGSMTLLDTYSFPGADVPESKSTVEVLGGKAFVAAGPEGVQVICLDNGQIVGSVPRPDPDDLGLDPSVVVTNAVTVDEDLMFISNGEAGVYVARAAQNFSDSGCSPQQLTVLGKLRFDDLQSANHIEFRDQRLVVAAGLGGLKLVRAKGI